MGRDVERLGIQAKLYRICITKYTKKCSMRCQASSYNC